MTNALNVSFYLLGVEMGAQTIVRNIKSLPFRRGFETRAEYELEQARKALTEALQAVEMAQQTYESLPVEA